MSLARSYHLRCSRSAAPDPARSAGSSATLEVTLIMLLLSLAFICSIKPSPIGCDGGCGIDSIRPFLCCLVIILELAGMHWIVSCSQF